MKPVCVGQNTKHPLDGEQISLIRQNFKLFLNQKNPLKVCLEQEETHNFTVTFFQGAENAQVIDSYSLRRESSGAIKLFQETCGRGSECRAGTEPVDRELNSFQENQRLNDIARGIRQLFAKEVKLDFLPVLPQLRAADVPLEVRAQNKVRRSKK